MNPQNCLIVASLAVVLIGGSGEPAISQAPPTRIPSGRQTPHTGPGPIDTPPIPGSGDQKGTGSDAASPSTHGSYSTQWFVAFFVGAVTKKV